MIKNTERANRTVMIISTPALQRCYTVKNIFKKILERGFLRIFPLMPPSLREVARQSRDGRSYLFSARPYRIALGSLDLTLSLRSRVTEKWLSF